MNTNVFVVFLIFLQSLLIAQTANYLFSEITLKEGLANINANFVQQDSCGFMWFGGNNILQRYDGHHFQNFIIGKNRSIPGSRIYGMSMDKYNRLWLLTGNQNLGYLDVNSFNYHPVNVSTPAGCENAFVALQVNSEAGVTLVYMDKTIATYDELANEVSDKYNPFKFPVGWEPRHVWQDEFSNYWVGTKKGLLKFSGSKRQLSYGENNQENDPVIEHFKDKKSPGFVYSLKNLMWVSFDNEVFSYDADKREAKAWLPEITETMRGRSYYLYGVQQFQDGSIWLTGGGILAKVDYQNHRVTLIKPGSNGPNGIRYGDINNTFQDREQSIWVSTTKGLFRFNPAAQIFYTVKNVIPESGENFDNPVLSFLETKDNQLLASTWGGGIFAYDSTWHPISEAYDTHKFKGDQKFIWSMVQTLDGNIYIGCQHGNLGKIDVNGQITWQQPDILEGSTIRKMVLNDDGHIWLGMHNGKLVRWNPQDNSFHLVRQLRRLISQLYIDSHQQIWATTDNDGVYCIDMKDGSLVAYYSSDEEAGKALLINGASDVLQYDDSTMIISSNGLNILNTKTHTFEYLDEGAQISSLLLDKNRNLWFATNTAIAYRSLEQRNIIYTFDSNDGIANFSFTNANGRLLKNGNIVFGTNEDILTFNPNFSVGSQTQFPKIYISEIWLGGKRINVDSIRTAGKLILQANQKLLTVNFTNNRFQNLRVMHYKVDGLDKDWKTLPSDGSLQLNYLPPGNYLVQAASLDDNFEQSKGVISLSVVVLAPFYKQWWFYSAVFLLMLGLVVWFDRERIRRIEAVQKIRSNIADKLHSEVNLILNNINVLSEMAKRKADSDPQKSKEFLEQINQKSQSMIEAMDDMLWSIAPENDSTLKMVERMNENIQAQTNQSQTPINLSVDPQVSRMNLGMQTRRDVFFVFKTSLQTLLPLGVNQILIKLAKEKGALYYYLKCDADAEAMVSIKHALQTREWKEKFEQAEVNWETQFYSTYALIECRIFLDKS